MVVQEDKEELSSADNVEAEALLKTQEEDSMKSDNSSEKDGGEAKDNHDLELGSNKDYVPLEYNQKLGQFETKKEEAEQSGGGGPTQLTEDMVVDILGPETYTACGLSFFQKLARPEIYFCTLCFLGLTQGMTRSYTGGTMTTIQRRFGLTTKTVGFISTGDDFLEILFSMHIAFMAGQGHRPRWLALGIFFAMGSCILHMIPHLIFGAGDFAKYTMGNQGNQTVSTDGSSSAPKIDWHGCGVEETEDTLCKVDANLVEMEQYTIIILQFAGKIGMGFLSILTSTIGVSYLDEAVPKDKFPFVVAVSACVRFMGPISGLSMSSWALTWWVDPSEHDNVSINMKHHKWVGAWWIGYIINTFVLLVPFIGFALLPRQLPSVRRRHIERLRAAAVQGKESLKKYSEKLRPAREPKFRDMIPSLHRLRKNPLFVALFLNITIFWFSVGCYFMYKSKYIENQFRMTASEANKYVAITGFISSVVGFLGMGTFLSFVKPPIKVIIMMTATITVILFGCFIAMLFVGCDFGEVHGMDIVLQNDIGNTKYSNSLSSCITSCECGREFSPVCVNDHHTYYSPCHAGCTNVTVHGKTKEYSNCACLGELTPGEQENVIEVKEGMCDTGCKDQFFMFIAITLVLKCALAANRSINGALFIRSVTDRDKDLALGLRSWVAGGCFLVTPIVIGALVDYTCTLWDVKCGKEGFCILYDVSLYRNIIFGIPAGGMVLAFFTEIVLLRWHDQIDFYGDKEKEDLGIDKKKTSIKENIAEFRAKLQRGISRN